MERTNKGKSIIDFPKNYVIIDIETTGLSPDWDSIIEVAALKYENGTLIDSFESLIQPNSTLSDGSFIDSFIEELTGITNEMLADAPTAEVILPQYRQFLSDSILIGHNVNFDINFLYDNFMEYLSCPLTNSFIDTMRLSRKLHPKEAHHRLIDLAQRYHIDYSSAHRSLRDCEITQTCFNNLVQEAYEAYQDLEAFKQSFNRKGHSIKASEITAKNTNFDPLHPLYQKVCVFTGTLEKLTRKNAMQMVADLGGINGDNVTKKTNFLILGNNDYCSSIKNGKSNKQKKAESLILAGADLQILSESTFYDLIKDTAPQKEQALFAFDFYEKLKTLLDTIILNEELPPASLHLYSNVSPKTKKEISKSICIYEPDYPEAKSTSNAVEKNFVIMNIQDKENRELLIRNHQFSQIPLPTTATIKQAPSDTTFIHVTFKENDENIFSYIQQNILYCLKHYESKAKTFGCCSQFIQCSDRKKCVHKNKLYSMACSYRKNLDAGRIFYGKNKNIKNFHET